jgi:hypothetical protein
MPFNETVNHQTIVFNVVVNQEAVKRWTHTPGASAFQVSILGKTFAACLGIFEEKFQCVENSNFELLGQFDSFR